MTTIHFNYSAHIELWEGAKLDKEYATAALYAQIIINLPIRTDINVAVY